METEKPPSPQELKFIPAAIYAGFYTHIYKLIQSQIELNQIKITLIKLAIGIIIVYVVLNIIVCIAAVLIPFLGGSFLTWLLSNIQVTPPAY